MSHSYQKKNESHQLHNHFPSLSFCRPHKLSHKIFDNRELPQLVKLEIGQKIWGLRKALKEWQPKVCKAKSLEFPFYRLSRGIRGKRVIDCSCQRGPKVFVSLMTYTVEGVLMGNSTFIPMKKSTSEYMGSSRQQSLGTSFIRSSISTKAYFSKPQSLW